MKVQGNVQVSFTYDHQLLGGSSAALEFSIDEAGPQSNAGAAVPRYSINSYPYNSVPLLEFTVNGSSTFGSGSGVVIGPHTILTASHMMFPGGHKANDWDIFMQYSSDHYPNPGSSGALSGHSRIHYFNVGMSGSMTRSQSQYDYAVIHTDHKFTSWFGMQSEYSGGKVHMTGYPSDIHGTQRDTTGSVGRDTHFDVLNYLNFKAIPGNSGGPIWIDKDPGPGVKPYVVGICSTTGWASLISSDTFNQIKKWVHADGYSLSRQVGDIGRPSKANDIIAPDDHDHHHHSQASVDHHIIDVGEHAVAANSSSDMFEFDSRIANHHESASMLAGL